MGFEVRREKQPDVCESRVYLTVALVQAMWTVWTVALVQCINVALVQAGNLHVGIFFLSSYHLVHLPALLASY